VAVAVGVGVGVGPQGSGDASGSPKIVQKKQSTSGAGMPPPVADTSTVTDSAWSTQAVSQSASHVAAKLLLTIDGAGQPGAF
jgi:hypothetical protein